MVWRAFKWVCAIMVVIIVVLWLSRGTIYRACFHYEVLRERNVVGANSLTFEPKRADDINGCINTALEETSCSLRFTTGKAESRPDRALVSGKANCIGYAALFKARCDACLKDSGMDKEWTVHQEVAEIHWGSFNIHLLFKSSFWKDHDIDLIENKRTGERIFVDPTLYDTIGVDRITGPSN